MRINIINRNTLEITVSTNSENVSDAELDGWLSDEHLSDVLEQNGIVIDDPEMAFLSADRYSMVIQCSAETINSLRKMQA